MVNRHSRVVVLKHMFSLQELNEDASLLLDLKDDVRDECSSLGEVTNVVLYDVWYIFPTPQSYLTYLVERGRRSDDSQVQRLTECSGLCHCMSLSLIPWQLSTDFVTENEQQVLRRKTH